MNLKSFNAQLRLQALISDLAVYDSFEDCGQKAQEGKSELP